MTRTRTRRRSEQGRRSVGRLRLTGAALAAFALAAGGAPALAEETTAGEHTVDAAWMVEEERVAGDLYETFAGLYPQATVFTRIARSEDRHVAAVERSTGEVAGTEVGVYSDPDLQAAYDAWLTQGSVSCEAALSAAVEVEKADIADLEDVIAQATADGTSTRVWDQLRAASERHLEAFSSATACTGSAGTTGVGLRGQGTGQGTGQGNGQGSGQGNGQGSTGAGARQRDGSCQDA